MIALITDKVIYEDKDTVSSEVIFFFFCKSKKNTTEINK